jgi:leucine efflux protein
MFLGITDIWTYVIGAFLITLLPGPNSLYVVSTAARRGVRGGSRAAVGVLAGDTVLITLTVVGAPVLESASVLFDVLKFVGAGYLACIGLGMFRDAWAAWRTPARPARASAVRPSSAVRSETVSGVRTAVRIAGVTAAFSGDPLLRALAVSLLNPKMIMFYVSFFVQFVDPSRGAPALSFLVLGLIIQAMSTIYLSVLIVAGGFLAARFGGRRRLVVGLTSGVGAVFLGFGLKLLTLGGG